MALAIMVITLILCGVILFLQIRNGKKLNELLELRAMPKLPKGKDRSMADDFEGFDIEKYLKEKREEEAKKKQEEEQQEQIKAAIAQISDNPELLAAIAKLA